MRVSEHSRLGEYGDDYVMVGEPTAAGYKEGSYRPWISDLRSIHQRYFLLDYIYLRYVVQPLGNCISAVAMYHRPHLPLKVRKCCTPEKRDRGSLQSTYYCLPGTWEATRYAITDD